MADGQPQYEIKTVQAIRGTEARTIAKWENDGWEVTGQAPAESGPRSRCVARSRNSPSAHSPLREV